MQVKINGRNVGVPPSWYRMGFTARAGYLCSVRAVRDYGEACAVLKRKPVRTMVQTDRQVRLPYID